MENLTNFAYTNIRRCAYCKASRVDVNSEQRDY